MNLGTRWQRIQSYSSLAAWSALAYGDDDELTWGDTPETLILAMRLGLIWSPQIALAIPAAAALSTPLAVAEGAFVVGAVASYAIGGLEGVETYVDYISDPVDIVTDPGKRDALIQVVEIEMALLNPVAWAGGQLGEYAGRELAKHADMIVKNRWMNPTPGIGIFGLLI